MSQNAPVLAQYNPAGIPRTKAVPAAADWMVGQDATGVYKTPASGAAAVGGGTGTISATGGAATLNKPAGAVTSESLTTATTYTLTLTNSFIKTTSVVLVNVIESTGAANPVLVSVTPGAGSVAIHVTMASFSGTLLFNFAVFN